MILSLALAFSAFYQPLRDADIYWHLAIGREIWTTGHLERVENFTFTEKGTPIEDTEWLFHICIYPLWKLGGETLLIWATALAGLIVFLQFARLVHLAGRGYWPAVFLALPVALPILADRIRCRPEIFSLLFEGVLFEILLRWKGLATAAEKTVLPNWSSAWCPSLLITLLFILWANVHGGWSFGLALLGLFLLGWLFDAMKCGHRLLPRLLPLALPLAGASAALFVTPYGWRIPWFPVKSLAALHDASQVQIMEWGRTPLLSYQGLYLVFSVAMLLFSILGKERLPFAWTLPMAAQVAFSFLWVRFVAHSALVVVPLVVLRLGMPGTRKWLRYSIVLGCLVLGSFVVLDQSRIRWQSGFPTRFDLSNEYPVLETQFLTRFNIGGNILHPYRAGGYLDFFYFPLGRTFMDGRYFPFKQLLREYDDSYATLNGFHNFLDRYPTEIVLQPYIKHGQISPERIGEPARGFFRYLYPEATWAPVYFGNYGGIFLRRLPKWKTIIKAHEYLVFKPDGALYLLWAREHGQVDGFLLAKEARRCLDDSPENPYRRDIETLIIPNSEQK
jgi:hypothetical protein